MATFGDVVSQIVGITRRAQHVTQIKGRVNSAIRKISGMGGFPQNLIEYVDPNNSNESPITIALPARFKGVSYVRPASCKRPLDFVNPATYETDECGYYVTGNNLLVKHPHIEDDIYYGLYIHPPNLVNDSDTNWILDSFEAIIVEMASAELQGILGNQAASQMLERYSLQFLRNEVHNYLSPYGD